MLRRARMDAERMVEVLQTRELALPAFLVGGAAIPLVAALGRLTGLLETTLRASVIAAVGVLIALAAPG
jgi:hypothetical protein